MGLFWKWKFKVKIVGLFLKWKFFKFFKAQKFIVYYQKKGLLTVADKIRVVWVRISYVNVLFSATFDKENE